MRTRPRRRRSVPVVLLAALALVLSACGGDGDSAAGADDASSTSRPFTLRLGLISASGDFTGPLGWLHERGELVPALAPAGVTAVEVITFKNGPDLNQALVAGELDVASYGDTPALVARGAGQPVRLIAQGRIDMDAGIVTRKGGPTSIDELDGARLSTQTGSYMHRYLLGVLGQEGVEPKEVVHLYVSDVQAALERGDIDAAAVPAENVEALRGEGYPVIDTILDDHPDLAGTLATVATERTLAAHPGLVSAWQVAQRTAHAAVAADWEGYLAFSEATSGFPPAVVRASERPTQYPEATFTEHGVELLAGTAAFLADEDMTPAPVEVEGWIADGARP